MQEANRKRKMMLQAMVRLLNYPEWQAFQAYLNELVDQDLLDMEGVSEDKRAYIILGKVKRARNILQLDGNTINILMDSTPDDGPVGEL